MNKSRWFIVITFLWLMLFNSFSNAEERQFVMVVDTSGSMNTNDPAKYSVQAAKIINDLLARGKQLSVIRFPPNEQCKSRYAADLVVSGGNTAKPRIENHIATTGSTHFSAPIATAKRLLDKKKNIRQMLLIISDVGGKHLFLCPDVKQNLTALKKNNVEIAGINIGEGNLADNNSVFDYATIVNDSPKLIDAVANVYQRFIGGKNHQAGTVNHNKITLNINPYVKEAYLVIAADGTVGNVIAAKNNPKAKKITLNYKGGGITRGWDNQKRAYRIVHLQHPHKGAWTFKIPQLKSAAGWMLIQDYSIGIRFVSVPTVPKNVPVTLEAKLYDEITGKDIDIAPDMQLSMLQQGNIIQFTQDGKKFTATITPKKVGKRHYVTRLKGKNIDKKQPVTFNVVEGVWIIQPKVPTTVTAGKKITLTIELLATNAKLIKPNTVTVRMSTGEVLTFKLNRKTAKKLTYTTLWTAKKIGKVKMTFSVKDKYGTAPATAETNVMGTGKFNKIPSIKFDKLSNGNEEDKQQPKKEDEKILDLSSTEVFGEVEVKVESNYDENNSEIQIKKDGKWIPIADIDQLILKEDGNNKFPVRLKIEKCPEEVKLDKIFKMMLSFNKSDGTQEKIDVEIKAEITPDFWLECWWHYILGTLIILLTLWIIHCIRSPARFPAEFGLVLSPEEDIDEEGIFHQMRHYKKTRRVFCRDAYIYMYDDFRFSRKNKGAFIKLQARKDGVYIINLGNSTLWWKLLGSDWEKIPANEETILRTSVKYRNDFKTVYFEAKNT